MNFKALVGVRARITNELFVGLYPFNPMLTDGAGPTKSGGVLFPTTLELGCAF